jgi:hypothetical protein
MSRFHFKDWLQNDAIGLDFMQKSLWFALDFIPSSPMHQWCVSLWRSLRPALSVPCHPRYWLQIPSSWYKKLPYLWDCRDEKSAVTLSP